MPEYMVFWKRLELFPRLWSWDGVCRFVSILECGTLCGKQEGIDSLPVQGRLFYLASRSCQSFPEQGDIQRDDGPLRRPVGHPHP